MDVVYDSDLEDSDDIVFNSVVTPYAYEPLRVDNNRSSSSSEQETDSESDEELAEGPPVEEWCVCSNCVQMPTVVESKCCKKMNVVDSVAEGLECITDHEGFIANFLNIHVLRMAFYSFIEVYGRPGEQEEIHEVYRYVAYRGFTRFIHGMLGKKVRRVIPSCAVNKIRQAFPAEQYAGFKYPQ